MAKLELEAGIDVLLMETGDALLLETLEYTESASVIVGLVVSATAELIVGHTRLALVIIGVGVSTTKIWAMSKTASVIVGVVGKAAEITRFFRDMVSFTNRKVMGVFTNLRNWINHTNVRSNNGYL